MTKRVMFYSHDTFGLGHIRRTQKIANAIASPDTAILVACSSPMANSFVSKPGIEYLSLPGIAKQVTGDYIPRSLNVPLAQFVALRSSLLLAAVQNFRPDVLVIDKEPLGVQNELLPALRYIRAEGMPTKVVAGFRDILDEKSAVSAEWARKGVIKGLEEYFDALFVYGEEANFDFVREYDLPPSLARRVVYTGYIQPEHNIEPDPFRLDFSEERPVVTFTLGGGGDGWNLIEIFLQMIEAGLTGDAYNHVLLSGPFANVDLVQRAKRLQAVRPDFKVIEFTSNAWGLFDRSAQVISMGGYNSVCELLQLKKHPLILPRITPRQEQLIRAKVFHAKGLCDYIHPDQLTPQSLATKLIAMARIDHRSAPVFTSRGLATTARIIKEFLRQCPPRSDSYSRAIHA